LSPLTFHPWGQKERQQLSSEAKETIVLKALNRGETTLESIARANNIGYSTLQKWIKCHRDGIPLERKTNQSKSSNALTRTEQFNHLLATSKLDEVSLGKYCREHGLYSHQLTAWRDAFMTTPNGKKHAEQTELKKLRKENQQLKKDLRRKEKALAEASALLVMKKKADLIWGEDADD